MAYDDARSLHTFFKDPQNNLALSNLLEEFQQLLCDALELLREVGEADDYNDRSFLHLPSITPHYQNRGFSNFVVLIELLRDSWLTVQNKNPIRAARIALDWFEIPYPTFKRLAFFAASHQGAVESAVWLDWLLSNDAWWLWASETRREVIRLLVLQGAHLSPSSQERLVAAILVGPPRRKYPDDLSQEDWQNLVDRLVWLRLSKLEYSGLALGVDAVQHLEKIQQAYPQWQLADNEYDEFSIWRSGTGYPDYQPQIAIVPQERTKRIEWLKQSSDDPFDQSNWLDVCRQEPEESVDLLASVAQEGEYPTHCWQEALGVWREKDFALRLRKKVTTLIQNLPDNVLLKIVSGLSRWLYTLSKLIDQGDKDILLDICQRILNVTPDHDYDKDRIGERNNFVNEAINHYIGTTTEAIINLWFTRKPNDNDGLPEDIRPLFTQLCDTTNEQFRHGRVLLAFQVISLFRVDRLWTEEHLLPLFDWSLHPKEAPAVWAGFLQSPRLYTPLIQALKNPFLNTTRHYEFLGEHQESFASFLTYAAVDGTEEFTSEEFQKAFQQIPQKALDQSAQALTQAPQGTGEQRANYWKNRIKPFWQTAWPKYDHNRSKSIANSLARLCIAVDSAFPEALETVKNWLQPIEYPGYILAELNQSDLCNQFPREALYLLDAVLNRQSNVSRELNLCLETIATADKTLEKDILYKKIFRYTRTSQAGTAPAPQVHQVASPNCAQSKSPH